MAEHKDISDSSSVELPEKGTSQEIEGRNSFDKSHAESTVSRRESRHHSMSAAERARRNANAKLANPLAGYSHAELKNMGAAYVMKHQIGDAEDVRAFELGACLAQDPNKFEHVEGLRQDELETLKKEVGNRWHQPRLMYLVIILCSTCAAVQGMGEIHYSEYSNYFHMLMRLQTKALSTVASFSICRNLVLITETLARHGSLVLSIQHRTYVVRL